MHVTTLSNTCNYVDKYIKIFWQIDVTTFQKLVTTLTHIDAEFKNSLTASNNVSK